MLCSGRGSCAVDVRLGECGDAKHEKSRESRGRLRGGIGGSEACGAGCGGCTTSSRRRWRSYRVVDGAIENVRREVSGLRRNWEYEGV